MVRAMGETHAQYIAHFGEIYQSMAQIVEKRTIYDHYSSDAYMDCSLKNMWITYKLC